MQVYHIKNVDLDQNKNSKSKNIFFIGFCTINFGDKDCNYRKSSDDLPGFYRVFISGYCLSPKVDKNRAACVLRG